MIFGTLPKIAEIANSTATMATGSLRTVHTANAARTSNMVPRRVHLLPDLSISDPSVAAGIERSAGGSSAGGSPFTVGMAMS